MKITVGLDKKEYTEKPQKEDISAISKAIAGKETEVEIWELANKVGNTGCTFTPAVFYDMKRTVETFKEEQAFALDFDTGISFTEVLDRSRQYHLPVTFAYHTFSSTKECERFRVVWIHEAKVTDRRAAKIILLLLLKLFPEADSQCAEVSRMFFGGRDLIYLDTDSVFDIETLAEEFQKNEFQKNRKNYERNICTFAKRNNLAVEHSRLLIKRVCQSGRIEEKISDDRERIYIEDEEKSSFLIVFGYQDDIRKEKQKSSKNGLLRLSDKGRIENCCRLYRDFVEGIECSHNERFLLLTNLLKIESGRKQFFQYLPQHTENIAGWEYTADYIKKGDYQPQSCSPNCPHCEVCQHKLNLYQTVSEDGKQIRQLHEESNYQPIEQVYADIQNNIRDAVRQSRTGIYLITAQTAIGKTSAYCDIVGDDVSRRYLIAVPTNLLKRQVRDKIKYYSDVYVTPSYDELGLPKIVIDEIQNGYRMGYKGVAGSVIRKFIKENQNSDDPFIQAALAGCRRYQEMKEKLKANPRVVITTHARLLHMDEDFLRKYTVIVDEDILLSIFQNMKQVHFSELQDALKSGEYSGKLEERIREILASQSGSYHCFHNSSEDVSMEGRWRSDNITEIGKISSYYVDENTDMVQYFVPQYLCRNCKYIVLSATLCPELYQMYFHGYHVVQYASSLCKYKGKLIQYTAHSLSRKDCKERFDAVYQAAKQISGAEDVLTFKGKTEEYGAAGVVMNQAGVYFGNASGINKLAGKDLIIIGTPHNVEYVYKLIGCHLGIETDDSLRRRTVIDRGFQFNFMTYENPALRTIQFFYIRSELEQAVGRARLLRKACTVYLFSNFPCEQAELVQDEYLRIGEVI